MHKLLPISLLLTFSCAAHTNCEAIFKEIRHELSHDSQQFLYVHPTDKPKLTGCQCIANNWQEVFTFPVQIGKNGIAKPGEKREGDNKTPSGVYALGPVFGTVPLSVKMDFNYITAEDFFVDDAESAHYNTWVTGNPPQESHEIMAVPYYRKGLIIQYNMHPAIPGLGSAIFMHIQRPGYESTRGCIALEEEQLGSVLKWLDKDLHPFIYIKQN